MAKLFSVKLANLENEMKDLKLNTSSATSTTKIKDLETKITELATQQAVLMARISDADTKINQMVNELTEILNKHANMIIDLQKQINSK